MRRLSAWRYQRCSSVAEAVHDGSRGLWPIALAEMDDLLDREGASNARKLMASVKRGAVGGRAAARASSIASARSAG